MNKKEDIFFGIILIGYVIALGCFSTGLVLSSKQVEFNDTMLRNIGCIFMIASSFGRIFLSKKQRRFREISKD